MPTFPPTPAALAEMLLREWETRTRPVSTPAYLAARQPVLALLTEFSTLLLRHDDINLDADDVRAVLRKATAFSLGRAETTGSDRAARLGALLVADLSPFPYVALPEDLQPVAALLSLQSGPSHELAMDELTEIVETVQKTALYEDTEMIFGHGISSEADEVGLLAWLLVGYAQEMPQPVLVDVTPATPKVPDEQGRDGLFEEAALLFVRQQRASSSLLQRELKTGYNHSQRLMMQLVQAGIIGSSQGNSPKTPVLIADEAALVRHLAQLPPLATD